MLVQAFIAYWLQSLTVVLWVVELTIVLISVLMSNTDVEAREEITYIAPNKNVGYMF